MSTIVFLGGGRITSAMLSGLRLGKTRHRLVVHDRNPAKLRDLRKRYRVFTESDLNRAVDQADALVIAVRPSSVRELLTAIGKVNGRLLAISLAAGVPLRVLSRLLGSPVRWARAMPSPLCRNGRALTAVTFLRTLSRADRKCVHDLFSAFGQVIEIPESRFDLFTVTFSPSHGYHALATLAQAAQEAGLDRKTALLASAHALADGIAAWRDYDRRDGDGGGSLQSLLDEAATPGGTAAATKNAMDAAGYGRAVRQGVAGGLRRARANAGR